MAIVDKAMDAASAAQRDRAHGQVSLLDVLSSAGAVPRQGGALPDLPEWDRPKLLAGEKETLGFYVTGHPLAEHRGLIAKHTTATTEDLASLPDKSTVKLGVMVVAVKEISTRNGDRMAFVTLEDLSGSVEAVVFPDLYRASMLHLAKDSAVLVKGQVDIGEETVKLLLSEVQPLTLPAESALSPVEVTLAGDAASSQGLRRLRALLDEHRGESPVRLHLELAGGGQVTIAPGPSVTVAAGEELRRALEAEFGPGCLPVG
jgi:DNA polymerase-3 subunit alpha